MLNKSTKAHIQSNDNSILTKCITTLFLMVMMQVMSTNTLSAKIVDSWIAGRDVSASNVADNKLTSGAFDTEGFVKKGIGVFDLQLMQNVDYYNFTKASDISLGLIFGGKMYFEYVQGTPQNGTVNTQGFTGGAYYQVMPKQNGTIVAYLRYTGGKAMYVFNDDGDAVTHSVDDVVYANSATPAVNKMSPAKLEFAVEAGKTYSFGVTGSKMMLMGVMFDDGTSADDEPVINATSTVDLTLNSYTIEQTFTNAITISGKNLTDGTYDVYFPDTDPSLTISPTNFTVTGGVLSNTNFTLTYHENAASSARKRFIYFRTNNNEIPEALGVTAVTLGKTAQRGLTEATTVDTRTTWDWSKAGTEEVKLIDPVKATGTLTDPQKQDGATYSILGNIAEITNDETFNSGALYFAGEYMHRTDDNSAQASYIKFHVEKPGKVSVTFASTSGNRNLYVNGTDTEITSTGASDKHTVTVDVPAGDVILTGKKSSSANPGDYLRYYSISYEPEITEAPEITIDLEESYDIFVGEQQALSITATGLDNTYKWYTCTSPTDHEAGKKPIDGATTSSYTYSPTVVGTTYIYCAATNDVGTTNSLIAAVNATVDSNIKLGLTSPLNVNAVNIVNPNDSHVTITNPTGNNYYTTCKTASNQNLYHGSSDSYSSRNDYKNALGTDGLIINTANGERGAETLNAYVGFNVNIEEGYKMNISSISSDIYLKNMGSSWHYEYIVLNAAETQIYKSPVFTIDNVTTNSPYFDNSISINSLKDLTGNFTIKFLLWNEKENSYYAITDFNIKATVEEIGADPESPIITTNVPASINNAEPAKEISVSIVGEHYKTIQWYKNTENSTVGGIPVPGQTKATLTYTPEASEKNSTLYFYAVLNNPGATGEKNAITNVVVVNVGARKDCKLTSLKLSNGFNAFVEMTAGVIEGYYMAGEIEPTIENYEVSGGATFVKNGNTITITAEDGTTKKIYDYRCTAIEPLNDASQQTMTSNAPEWIKGGHWHNSEPFVYEAWKHTDQYMQNGYNRIYLFIGPCELLHIDVGSTSRFVKGGKGIVTTYIDGVKTENEVTLPAVGEYINIPCSMEHNTLIEIVNLSTTNEWGFLNVQQDKKLHLTYEKGDVSVEGSTPENLEMPSIGANFTIPQTNYSLFKPGYTMTGWTDGANTYNFNTNYLLTEDITLTPIWKKNGMEAEDVNSLVATWLFGMKGSGGVFVPTMNLNETTGVTYYVTQQDFNGVPTDMAMTIQNGVFENLNTTGVQYATVGTGTEFTAKVVPGAILEVRATNHDIPNSNYYDIAVMSNGVKLGDMVHSVPVPGQHIFTYTVDNDFTGNDATLKFTFHGAESKNGKIYYLKVTYPTKTESDIAIIEGKSNIKLDYRNPEKNTYQLTQDIDYTTSSDGKLDYLSSNEDLATVDEHGNITAIAGGDVTISVVQKATATKAGGRIDFFVNIPFPADLRFFNGTTLTHTSYTDTGEAIGEGKLPVDPTAPGKNFVGWYTLANGAGVKATPYTIINEPTDFYALFMDEPQLVDGFYQLGLTGSENPGQRGDKLVNAITWATRQNIASESGRIKIWIPNGTYDLRELTCTEVGNYISLIGESQNGVVIQNMPEREGLHSTATLKVTGNEVVMQNLTLKNVIEDIAQTTDPETNQTYERGVCLEDCGTGNVYREVRLLGRQNTYYASTSSVNSYFENSELHGTIDMIGGDGSVWFEECQLKIEQNTAAYIAAPETTGSAKGFIFNGCTISNVDGASMANKYYLGHGLTSTAKVAYYNTTKTIAYKESGWGQSESGAQTSDNSQAHSSEAISIIGQSVSNANKLDEPEDVVTKDGNVTWEAVSDAGGYVLYLGGERVKFLTTNSYTLPQGAATSGYTVATISQTGIIGDAAFETTAPVITKDLDATQECYVGKTSILSIEATGSTTTYQWYKSSKRGSYVIVADPANVIPDATAPSYNYTADAEGDAWFCCKATNSQGDTYSTVIMVTAKNPEITIDLRSIYNVKTGDTKELAIAANGGDTYQWYTCSSATDSEADKTVISDATSPLLEYTPAADGTTYIYCRVNDCVNTSITSLVASANAGSTEKTEHTETIKEFYDFKTFTANGSPTLTMNSNSYEQSGTNANTVYEINNPTNASGTLELNGRFAIDNGPSAAKQMRWMWRYHASNDYQRGLGGNWNGNGAAVTSYNLSVLGLYPGDKVTVNYVIRATKPAEVHACNGAQITDGANGQVIQSGVTYTIAEGANQLDLYATNDNLGIHSIQIESHWYATAEPTINIQPTASCKTYVGVPRVLSIDATDANTYQWYVNSEESKNGATAIEGATTNMLTYIPETAGTDYVFCVVGNDNGYKSSDITEITVDPDETIILDFQNRPDDDNVLVLGSENTLKANVPLYNVVTPYEYAGYLATGADYRLNNGLTNTSNGGDRPIRIIGLSEGDIVTIQGYGFKIADHNMYVYGGTNATIDYLADNFATIHMTADGDLTLNTWRQSLVHIYNIIVKKKATSNITTDINDKYFIKTNAAQTLTIASDGTDDTYQWYSNTTKVNKGGIAIDGATSTTYSVPTNENGTTYYYCLVTNASGTVTPSNVAQVDVADVIFRDFELDVRQKRDYGLTATEVAEKSTVSFGVVVEENGTLRRVETTDPEYETANVHVSGTYKDNTLGLEGATFVVPVQGKVKFSIGRTDNADENLYGDVTVTDASGKLVTILSTKGGKWASNKKNVDYGYYSGTATTLTFTTEKYVPYIRIEAVEVSASEPPAINCGTYNVSERQWEYTMSTNADGATIYYTTDGTSPTPASSSMTNGSKVLIPAEATIKAYAVCDGWYDSEISTAVAPVAPAAKSTEVISYHNGETGDNIGTSYTVTTTVNGGQPAVFDDGLKFNTTSITYEDNTTTTTGTAFRINVNTGYRITGITVKGLGNDAPVTVSGIYADLADIAIATNYLTEETTLPASGEAVEFNSNALMTAEKYVDIMTTAEGVANLQVTVSYEYADEVTGISIDGTALTAEQVNTFNTTGVLTIEDIYAGNPEIVITTKLGYNYTLQKPTGDDHVYTFDMIGAQKTITLSNVLKPLPVITIDENKFYFGERDAEGQVTKRGYDFTVTGEAEGGIKVIIDGGDPIDYTSDLRALESVEAYYTAGEALHYPETHVTAHASTGFDKNKPFAAYVYKSGYDDKCGDLEPLDAKMIIDGIGKTYNVVPVVTGEADPTNAEHKKNLDAADLVVLTEAMGSGDAPFKYVNTAEVSPITLPNNILNLKMFAVKKATWNWHSGATTLDNSVLSMTPVNANYYVFNGVSFDDNVNNTITLWSNPVDRAHFQGLDQNAYTDKINNLAPPMQKLATVTNTNSATVFDVLEYFENNGHTFVQFGLSINDYRHYNENVKAIVSNICEMLNAGTPLNYEATELTKPVITDNGNGTATIRTSIPLATLKYVALAPDADAPDADYIKANGITLNGQTTRQYSVNKKIYAIAIMDGKEDSEVSEGTLIHGSNTRKVTRRADITDGVKGVDITLEYDANDFTIPYNQSFKKEGYTVKKWVDEQGNEYIPGAPHELEQDLVLTAVWEANTKTVTDFTTETADKRTATFEFLPKNGAPRYEIDKIDTLGIVVGQVRFDDGDFIDVAAEISFRENTINPIDKTAYSGKFWNTYTNSHNWFSGDGNTTLEYCQIKTGTVFTFPAVYGMTVNLKAIDLEQDNLLNLHRSYVTTSVLSDGTLLNAGYEYNQGKGEYELINNNYDEGGQYEYSGKTMAAELLIRESSIVHSRATTASPISTVLTGDYSWNHGSCFMNNLSVTYPVLYSVITTLVPEESSVAIGEPTANITYIPEAPENTKGKFTAGTDIKMIVTPTYAQKYDEESVVPTNVTVTTTGDDVPDDGAVYSFTMPDNDMAFTIKMTELGTREIKSYTMPLDAGRIAYTPDYVKFVDGKQVTITANPKVGYEFKKWTTDRDGNYEVSGTGYEIDGRSLTMTVDEDKDNFTFYAQMEKGKTGTVYYMLDNAVLLNEDNTVEQESYALKENEKNGFPLSMTESAMIIPLYYTMYKEGYTLDHWIACDEHGNTIHTGGDDDGVYSIGSYYYFANEGDVNYIKPVFRKNKTNFDYRTTEVDITWDFRTAYFAQPMDYDVNKSDIHYSTHSTINRPADASGVVTMDVPIIISTGEEGKVYNKSLDEWCTLGEGTQIKIPSGLDATFTLTTFAPITSTKIDDDVLKTYTRKTENNVDVYVYTYKTKSTKTSVTLTIGDDFSYYKNLRAQLPSAEKVEVNTSVNVAYMGSASITSTGTKPDGDDLDIFDVTEGNPSDGSKKFRAPLGSYVTAVAKRNRLYEFDKWVDGEGNEIIADGTDIIITTDRDANTGEITSKLNYRLVEYITNLKAIFRERPQYQINYTAGQVATGIAPPVVVIEKGESFTLPSHNQVLYLEGHTLQYWLDKDGNKFDFGQTYTPGKTFNPDGNLPSGTAAFIVPDGNIELTPVFMPNEFSFGDILDEVTITWPLAKIEGATSINYHKSSGVLVDQLEYDGMKIDLPLEILSFEDSNTASNANDENFCTISGGMVIGVPATPGCRITLNSFADNVTTTEIGRYRGVKMTLEQKETKQDADGCWDGTEIPGSTSTTIGALTTGAYTAGISPTVTCTNEKGYGILDINFKGDATSFTSIQAVYSAITIPMPELSEVSVGSVKLGSGIYGKYSVVDLNSDKELNNIRVNAIGEKLPEVKVTTVNNLGVAKIVQPTVADPRATIILKTDSGIVAGVYVLNFKVGRVTGTPNLESVKFYRKTVEPTDAGIYDCGTVAPNSVMELTFDRVMAEKTIITAKDIELDGTLRGRLDSEITASEGQTLKFTFWDLEMGQTYKFRIKANTLEDVYGNPYTEDIWFQFTVSTHTMQNTKKALYNFVVTEKETFDHSVGGNIENQRSGRTIVASEELINNLDALNIPHGTIDEAIAAANNAPGTDAFYIFVPDGEYQIGGNYAFPFRSDLKDNKTGTQMTEDMCFNKTYNNGMTKLQRSKVSITGQSQDKTVIFNDPYFYGLRYSATLQVDAKATDCYFQDLTFDNRYSWFQMQNGTTPAGQSAAFYDIGLRTILKNVGVFGFQDSYRSDASNSSGFMGRGYYETCTFAGTVDFICGDGDMWWEKCRFLMRHRGSNNLCAPRQLDYQKWGYVYSNCTIDAEDEAKSHAYMNGGWGHSYSDTYAINKNFTIGRPWDESPAATYLYTNMVLQPSSVGWASMKDEGLTLRFQEYGSMAANGEPIDLSVRTTCISTPGPGSYDAVMSPEKVKRYTIHNVLGGDEGYDPTVYTEQRPAVVPGFDDTELTWHDDEEALCYAIFKSDTENGEYKLFAITTESNYDCGEDAGWYKVRAANQRGGLGEWSIAVQYVPVDKYELTVSMIERDSYNHEIGWSTICLPFNAKVPDKDLKGNPLPDNFKVYAATKIQDNIITLKRVHYITSNIGYVVYGTPGNYIFKGSTHYAQEYDGFESLLDGNPTKDPIPASGTNCYTLAYKPNVSGIGFYKFVGITLAPYKAFLTVDVFNEENEKNASGSVNAAQQNAARKGIRFIFEDFEDAVTGIYDNITDEDTETDEKIYDLNGRMIRRKDMIKGGVYITNGKKIQVR